MRILLMALLLMTFTGCAKVVDDFVSGGDPAMTPPGPPNISGQEDGALKLSPGMVRATGGTVGMTARITNDRLLMTGTNMSATIGLHKSR